MVANRIKLIISLLVFSSLFLGCEEPDTTAPTVTVIYPTHATSVSEVVGVTCVATDNVGIERVELWVDGVSTGLTDNTEPYSITWNTTQYVDGSTHVVTVRAYDVNDNKGDSDPVTITIDQSDAYPAAVNITNVSYDTETMTIGWERSQDNDFSKYELYSGLDTTNFELLATIDHQDSTAYFVSEFDPRVNNYFRVTVYDTLGLSSSGNYLSNALHTAPNAVNVTNVSYTLSEMTITWETYVTNLARMQSMLAKHGQSSSILGGTDFTSYELLYSETENGTKVSIASFTDIDSTTYILTEFDPTHENWFWVKVTDYWGLTSVGEGMFAIDSEPIASFSVSPFYGTIEQTFSFDASGCSDIDEATSMLQVRWDWETDGDWDTGYSSTKTESHQFTVIGSYLVTMEVKDSWGLTGTIQETIIVAGLVTDIDGNVYETVAIGDQVWMAENLMVTHYRNGDEISTGYSDTDWANVFSGAYCIYNDNTSNEVDTYGALYNWYAATDSRNIAPEGWHVPTDDDWKELEMALGMSQSGADNSVWRGTNEGSKLAGNADLWNNGALENDSEFGTSGFTALPGGNRYDDGRYDQMGAYSFFWSATEYDSTYAWYRGLLYYYSDVLRYNSDSSKRYGFSVRCVKD